MLQEIANEFEVGAIGVSGVEFSLMYDLAIFSITRGWSDYGDVRITSHKKTDAYTYTVYGTFKSADEYGSISSQKFTLTYCAEYSAEDPEGYVISYDTSIH